MATQQEKQSLLGSAPIGKLMAKLALPSIVAQVINILYNIRATRFLNDLGSL